MTIANTLNLLPLSAEQKMRMAERINGSVNRFYAWLRTGHEPTEHDLVEQFIIGGGVDVFRKEFGIPQAS